MSAASLTAVGSSTVLPVAPDEAGAPSTIAGWVAIPGQDEIVALTHSGSADFGKKYAATGYSLNGQVLFETTLQDFDLPGSWFANVVRYGDIAFLANGNVAFTWNFDDFSYLSGASYNHYAVVTPSGRALVNTAFAVASETSSNPHTYPGPYSLVQQGAATLYATASGFTAEWNASAQSVQVTGLYAHEVQTVSLSGAPQQRTTTPEPAFNYVTPQIHAFAAGWNGGADSLQLADNLVQYDDGASVHAAVAIPGEPAASITDDAAAMLAGGHAAVAWVDSGTDYVSIFDPVTNSFGARIGLDWGGAQDVHVVALPDGGFAMSWMNGGAYKGEVFDAAGNGGGIISLAGDVAGIDSQGELYTLGLDPSGREVVQKYAVSSPGGSSGGGGSAGQTFTSDNGGDHWTGTAGNDTFNLGRGGDVVAGAGGNDTFRFAEIPWAGGHITDFNAGDVLDLTGLMSTTSDTGSDGFADGYLKIIDDGAGNAQVWADYHLANNDGWWLVATLDGAAPSSLAHTGDMISIGGFAGGGGTPGQTFTSDNNGNVIVGTAGDDTFHLGRGGDRVTGGAGADTFAYAAIPWAGGHITDFNAAEGDRVDVSGLLAQANYTGSDPFGDAFLKFGADASGNAQIWADYNLPGNDGWWLVATLDGVSTSSLHYSGGMIT